MPVVPRPNNKATKVLYSILGKPANIASKPSKKLREINERLKGEERMRLK